MALEHADEMHLLRAIEFARLSRAKGNHPFGSLLVDASGRVVLEAEITVVTEHDVTGHAELNLVRRASMQFDVEALGGVTLYTSTEPCAMCSSAIYWSGIGRSGTLALSCREVLARGGRTVEVSGPHLEEQARPVHEGFWN